MQQDKNKKPSILMVAAECAPFVMTGGLGDVIGALSREILKLGYDIRIMLPYHRKIKNDHRDEVKHLLSFSVDLGWRSQYVGVEELDWNGIKIYLIDNEYYFGDAVYRGGNAEGEQYCFFNRAVLEALPEIGFIPDIIHVNDWHTAMIPMLVKTQYKDSKQGKCKTVLSMHSLGYQGKFDFSFVSDLLGVGSEYYKQEYIENYGCANFLKAGIVFADKLVTVSPTYAQEIKTQYYGEGLEGVLESRAGDLAGIINGIDTEAYDPASDKFVQHSYSADDTEGKQKNKEELCKELGLSISPDEPLIAMVTRLTGQKGMDLVTCVFDDIISEKAGFVLLGTGERSYEDFFRSASRKYPGRVCGIIKFDTALSHRIYAGSDFLLMPSRFEPCGISQQLAQRYGTLPIVRATGGLKDTVAPYNEFNGEGSGFSFDNYNAHDMLHTIQYALKVYGQKEKFKALIKNTMALDLSFEKSAKTYCELYSRLK